MTATAITRRTPADFIEIPESDYEVTVHAWRRAICA
jgi:hypothetical protein